MDAENILLQAIAEYGKDAQTDMMIEAMAELTKALLKRRRYPDDESTVDNIREEMADVQIMMDQMRIIYGDDSQYTAQKLHRLAQRTGCSMCGFGIHLEKRPHRFDMLYDRNQKEWDYWMHRCCTDSAGEQYGWDRVLDYIGVPWRRPDEELDQIDFEKGVNT